MTTTEVEGVRSTAVTLSDGVRLHVELAGPDDAPVTVLLSHGWTCSTRSWHHQLDDLPGLVGASARIVAYDHRGHGRSDGAAAGTTTIDQLARDLVEVLDALVPAGPVVYAGHSMGGMTAMALAEQHPGFVGDRIAGLVLVSTSSGEISTRPFGLPSRFDRVAGVLAPRAMGLAGSRADRRAERYLRSRAGRHGADLTVPRLQRPAIRRATFGRGADPAEVEILMTDLARTPGRSLSGYFAELQAHDRADALKVFDGLPVEIMHGTRDRLLSPRHANRMAQLLPDARLWMYPGAGHMLMQERPRDVTHRIAALARNAAIA